MRLLATMFAALVACDSTQTTPDPQDSTGGGGDDEVDGGIGGSVPDAAVGDAAVDTIPPNLTPCEEAVYHSDLTWIQDKIFNVSCDSSHCHGGTTPKADLHLTPGHSHHELVNVRSTIHTSWMRVVPGNPDASILLVRLGGAPGPGEGTMPLNQARLCQEKIDAVRRWIASGAPNN